MQNSAICYRIGVFGHYGHANLGDEAIIEATIQNLRDRLPTVQITGLSMDAVDTSNRYGIPAYTIRHLEGNEVKKTDSSAKKANVSHVNFFAASIGVSIGRLWDYLRRIAFLRAMVHSTRFLFRLPRLFWLECGFLYKSYRVARKLDCLFVAGSNQFLDNFGGVWGFPYTLLKWTVLARCAGARVIFVSVGAGPIDSIWSRIFVRGALFLADYVSFRDDGSRKLIEWFGSGGRWQVYPDLAQSLMFESGSRSGASDKPVVGINPMPVYDRRAWCEPDDFRYEHYISQLALFVCRLLRDRYPVFFFATQPSDEPVIDDVISRLDANTIEKYGLPNRWRQCQTVAGIMNALESADIVVPTRYHGTVLALRAGRPVLGICYYRKTREVLKSMDQQQYAIDLDRVCDAELWSRFVTLVANREEETRTIERRGAERCKLLAEQYDCILQLLGIRVDSGANISSSNSNY